MSSTNRGYNRHKSDYYVTPISEIDKFLDKFIKVNDFEINKHVVLDPCAGGDENHVMSYPEALTNHELNTPRLYTSDIRKDSKADKIINYLEYETPDIIDVIITNPPFNIAENIIKKALDDVQEGGYVIMLLRLNYFGSKKRNKWLLQNTPNQCYIHAKRMSFTDNGSTDSIEYAHFVWQKGVDTDYTKTYLLQY